MIELSGIEALNKLTERYPKVGKKLHLKPSSKDCLMLLQNADEITEVNIMEYPTYKGLIDKRVN